MSLLAPIILLIMTCKTFDMLTSSVNWHRCAVEWSTVISTLHPIANPEVVPGITTKTRQSSLSLCCIYGFIMSTKLQTGPYQCERYNTLRWDCCVPLYPDISAPNVNADSTCNIWRVNTYTEQRLPCSHCPQLECYHCHVQWKLLVTGIGAFIYHSFKSIPAAIGTVQAAKFS